MNLLFLFIVLNVLNVIIQTIKSLATIKCGKVVAAVVNAIAYGLYTIVIVYTASDGIDLYTKALIVALSNLVGVYVVKSLEEKARKDRLWKIEATFKKPVDVDKIVELRENKIVSCYYQDIGDWIMVSFFAKDKKQSKIVEKFIKENDGKYFIAEGKSF